MHSGANPSFTPAELAYQIQATKASLLVTHPDTLSVALSALQTAKLPTDRVVVFDGESPSSTKKTYPTVQDLIDQGLSTPAFRDRKLSPGEGKTKIAFLNFSSGTTGRPKVSQMRNAFDIRFDSGTIGRRYSSLCSHNQHYSACCPPQGERGLYSMGRPKVSAW